MGSLLQEIADSVGDIFFNDGFISLIQVGKEAVRIIKKIATQLVKKWNDAAAVGVVEAMKDNLRQAMSEIMGCFKCLLVLVDPTPCVLGTAASDVSNLMASSPVAGAAATFLLTLKDHTFWMKEADHVFKTGAAAAKMGQKLETHAKALSDMTDQASLSITPGSLEGLVKFCAEAQSALRPGAIQELQVGTEKLLRRMAKDIMEETYEGDMPVRLIHVVSDGIGKFAQAEGMWQLKQEFKQWQSDADHVIASSSLKAFLEKTAGNLGDMDKVREDVKTYFTKTVFHASKPVEVPSGSMADMQKLAAAMFERFHQQARESARYFARRVEHTV